MNCAKHPDTLAVAFCRSCGKAMCDACLTKAHGTVFCDEHRPPEPKPEKEQPTVTNQTTPLSSNPISYDPIYGRPEYSSPYTAPQPQAPPFPNLGTAPLPPGSISPGLAFLLGWIPGVGAIYNGQYAKGLMHVVIFGLLVTMADRGALEPLMGMLIGCMVFYMPFEAYHTAKRRMNGVPVDEFSSLIHIDSNAGANRFPAAPIVMIGLGVLFLLSNFDLVRIEDVAKFWPVAMIGLGVYLLLMRARNQRRLP